MRPSKQAVEAGGTVVTDPLTVEAADAYVAFVEGL